MRIYWRRLCLGISAVIVCACMSLFTFCFGVGCSNSWDTLPNEMTRQNWLINRQTLLASGVARKVLLLSYMRGGSKIIGEVFNRDPDAIMWHEPMAAYFMAKYGVSFANLPQHTLFTNKMEKVQFSTEERSEMARYLSNIYTCHYNGLPPHTWMHKFLFFTEAETIKSLRFCLKPKRQHAMVDQCKHLGQTCGNIVESRNNKCPHLLRTSRELLTNMTRMTLNKGDKFVVNKVVTELNVQYSELHMHIQSSTRLKSVVTHEWCVDKMRRENQHCMTDSIGQCTRAKLQVAKVNRMRMEDTDEIIEAHPDLMIIHYVRDPRAIAASRVERGLCMDRNTPDVIQEAKLVCQRMREDIQRRKNLESKYQNLTITIRYEDLILDPVGQSKYIYKFIGIAFPIKSDWFEYAKTVIYGDKDHLSTRRNGTQSIDKWKDTIDKQDILVISRICADVINELGYQ